MPQSLKDIEERVELLKMTLGMFAPSEPAPVMGELVQLAEEVLEHALIAAGEVPPAPTAGETRLLVLLAQLQEIHADLAALAEPCRRLLEHHAVVAADAEDAGIGMRLQAAAETVAGLYSAVTGKLPGERQAGRGP